MVQEVTKPTREQNTLDRIATNFHERVNKTEVFPGISDHHIVVSEISIHINRRRQDMESYVASEMTTITDEMTSKVGKKSRPD